MTDFIDDPFNYILENCDVRDYKGYQQHREVLFEIRLFGKVLFRLQTPWLFLVTGLQDDMNREDTTSFIVKYDGSFEEVLIGSKNRINISGKEFFDWSSYC